MCNKLGDNSDGFISAEEFEELKDYGHGQLIRVFATDQRDDGQTKN